MWKGKFDTNVGSIISFLAAQATEFKAKMKKENIEARAESKDNAIADERDPKR